MLSGTFARVCLCLHKPSSKYFALKILTMQDVIKLKQVQHVKSEKKILQEIQHPFLISLLWSSKDAGQLYLMFPFIGGGELFSYLRRAPKFSVSTTKFFSAEIVSALTYLHSLHIVYRDLKPENILLAKDGHVIITDFGFSKKVPDRTWTLCGTPEYLAPEIIQSKGHNKAVDWWALGILIYEMLIGYPPFYDENHFVIYQKILAGKIDWPKHLDSVAKDLIKKLLVKDRTRRLGSMKGGAEDVKNHRFFYSLDWQDVYFKHLAPPIVPSITSEEDTSNFEDYTEEESKKRAAVSKKQLKLFEDF